LPKMLSVCIASENRSSCHKAPIWPLCSRWKRQIASAAWRCDTKSLDMPIRLSRLLLPTAKSWTTKKVGKRDLLLTFDGIHRSTFNHFIVSAVGMRTTIAQIDKDADLRNYIDAHGGRFTSSQMRELKYEKYEMVCEGWAGRQLTGPVQWYYVRPTYNGEPCFECNRLSRWTNNQRCQKHRRRW
jgi:hypothetical protein